MGCITSDCHENLQGAPDDQNRETFLLGTPNEFGNSAYVFDLCASFAWIAGSSMKRNAETVIEYCNMNAIRDGLKRSFANSDWTLISLGVFCILPAVWWDVVDESPPIPSSYLIEFGVSILVWIVALISYLRSTVNWQKALCLQLGLMLAPATNQVISYAFWSTIRPLVVASQFSPQAINTVFLVSGLAWIGLMFIPALLPLSVRGIEIKSVFGLVRNITFYLSENTFSRSTLLIWFFATFTGAVFTMILGTMHALWWAAPFPLGVLQSLVLRRLWNETGNWLLATTAGLVCGAFLSARFLLLDLYVSPGVLILELDPIFIWSTLGTALGLSQWFVLRHHAAHAYWWIVVNMIAGLVGSYLSTGGVIGLLVTSLLIGAATGIVLIQLSSDMDVPHTSEKEEDIG
jgi:hypothetical protein